MICPVLGGRSRKSPPTSKSYGASWRRKFQILDAAALWLLAAELALSAFGIAISRLPYTTGRGGWTSASLVSFSITVLMKGLQTLSVEGV